MSMSISWVRPLTESESRCANYGCLFKAHFRWFEHAVWRVNVSHCGVTATPCMLVIGCWWHQLMKNGQFEQSSTFKLDNVLHFVENLLHLIVLRLTFFAYFISLVTILTSPCSDLGYVGLFGRRTQTGLILSLWLRCEPFLQIVKVVFSVARFFSHICTLVSWLCWTPDLFITSPRVELITTFSRFE